MSRLFLISTIISFVCAPAFAQRSDLTGLKFCIDPGHGGHNAVNDRHVIPDPGIDFWESESNFQKALQLKALLESHGATVILTRNTNDYPNDADEPSLTARWTLANANNVDWFHSIHSNATGGNNTSTNYTMVLIKEDIATRQAASPAAIDMSSLIYNSIRAKDRTQSSYGNITGKQGVYLDYTFYGGPNGGFNLGVLRGLAMPGELSEGSFHDFYPETRRLMNNSYRRMEAYGILDAFLQYYGVPLDTFCIVAGIQTNGDNGKPVNATKVILLPENRVYTGDSYNDGYYLFDSLASGSHEIVYETDGYSADTVDVVLAKGEVKFVDRVLESLLPPIVASSSPARNSQNVNALSSINISFTKAMDTASVESAFSITPSVGGSITWKDNFRTLCFTPSTHFGHLTNYNVTIGGSAKSVTGFFLDGNGDSTGGDPFTLSFTTEAAIAPYVVFAKPSNNDTSYSISGIIGVRFSKPMDTASVRAAFSITPSVDGTLAFTINNTTVTFTPKSKLPYGTAFVLRFEGTAASADGVFLDGNKDSTAGDAFVLNFRTEENPTSVAGQDGTLPADFALMQNYPNPFNPSTAISYSVPSMTGRDLASGGQLSAVSNVTLKVYDVLGREVATLVNERQNAGYYTVTFSIEGVSSTGGGTGRLPSGVYFYKLKAGNYTATNKMVAMK